MTPIPPARVNVRGGYTLVEILVATTLTLILMFAVVQIFAMIGGSVSESRALLEMNDRLRAAKTRLQMDLDGLTVVPLPPRGEEDDGYLEIIEGPVGVSTPVINVAKNLTEVIDDTTVADFDDVLMFTTRNARTPFVGTVQDTVGGTVVDRVVESDVAEVAWFVHGNRLYRRVRPIERPTGTTSTRPELAELTRRENRHPQLVTRDANHRVILPDNTTARDFWANDANATLAANGFAPIDTADVILTNVIGFDVKVFDTSYGDYVDLGYNPSLSTAFSHLGNPASGLQAASNGARVYDTWSASYEVTQDVPGGSAPYSAPYPSALRGIQIKIRVFEPDSRQIREVTVIQDFLPR